MLLGKAIALTADAYKDKCDKQGELYFFHCLQVMKSVKDQGLPVDVQCAAIMHDLIEDFDEWTLERVMEEGFSERTQELLDLLTHRPEDHYVNYISRVASDREAILIKMADLTHNSSINRMKGVGLKDLMRNTKYQLSYYALDRALMATSRLEIDHIRDELFELYTEAETRLGLNMTTPQAERPRMLA